MDGLSWTEYSRFVVALLAVLDPPAAIPIFLDLTRGYSTEERRRTARVTSLSVLFLLAGAALAGETVLYAFGTSLAAFRVGGGIVVLLMALSMLMAQPGAMRHAEAIGRLLGPIGVNVAVRLFGLVLAAIAVEFIVNGLKQMLPVLAGG